MPGGTAPPVPGGKGGLKGSAALLVLKNYFNQNTKQCENIKESVWVEHQRLRKKKQIIVQMGQIEVTPIRNK